MAKPTITGKLGFYYDGGTGDKWIHTGEDWVPFMEEGIPGPQGPQGEQGPAGIDGAQGIQGETGLTGADGAVGPQGVAGVKGDTGDAGADGVDGAVGPQGIQGDPGTPGVKGDTGLTGDAGADGADGAQGLPGVDGAQGVKGDTGDTGDAGIQGPAGADSTVPGPTGPTGADSTVPGPQGETGPEGPSAVSADADNVAVLGSDSLIYVPKDVSSDPVTVTWAELVASQIAGTVSTWDKYIISDQANVEVEIKFQSPDGMSWFEKITNDGVVELVKVTDGAATRTITTLTS